MAGSYRRALQETVCHYCGWKPSAEDIDQLKGEGAWNNDWDASLELLRRHGKGVPERDALIDVFSGFYFGGDPEGDPSSWSGFIGDEPLLVSSEFFEALNAADVRWGFVSGAEPPSARYVLTQRLGLHDPPLIAMGDAPDKPDPTGLIRLATQLAAGDRPRLVAYLGDTVADINTVVQAKTKRPELPWLSLGVTPPHVQDRQAYRQRLQDAGADHLLDTTTDAIKLIGEEHEGCGQWVQQSQTQRP